VGIRDDVATFEEEGAKEAPAEYILDILSHTYPHANKIENIRDKHLSGIDWVIHWKTGKTTNVDDKNDLWLGYTGNISLDEATLEKQDIIQLFVNYPKLKGKYLFIFNNMFSPQYVKQNALKRHGRLQTWGQYTYTYIIPLKVLKHKIYKIQPKLANPSFNYFCKKRKGYPVIV